MKVLRPTSKELQKICQRHFYVKRRVQESVAKIIDGVRVEGDDAVIKYTRRFDKVKLAPKQIRVSDNEILGAYQNINPKFVSHLKIILENVTKFYKKQLKKQLKIKDEDGVILGEIFRPIERVGVYVPSGTCPLISTVYMTVVPAKIAGVKEIVLTTPPNKQGFIDPHILVVANLLKVDRVYKIGGAQAIAALAFGTKSVPKVDKIVGPGNQYVTEAKRQVFGYVDIDMLAGPTELVVIANKNVNIDYILADMNAQSEHIGGLSILITNSKTHVKALKSNPLKGYIIQVKNLEQAAEVSNRIAPEHLEILVNNPRSVLKNIKHAGAIFLGPYTPTAVGDYVAGPSHVLPTSGTARFFSSIGLNDFIKTSHVISYSKKALEKIMQPLETVAALEGLTKHLESAKIRFK